jgi:hypothetical protein
MMMPRSLEARPLTAEMRRMLLAASVLVLAAGAQLFILSELTDRYFAWTVAPPLTAAFLGAAFWASFVLEYLASREPDWAHARVAVPAVLVFTTLMLIATLLHLDRFHLDSAFGWVWIAVYVVVPPTMLVFLLRQLRAPGVDPPRGAALPAWLQSVLAAHAVFLLGLGIPLFIAPTALLGLWPWMLTPLTARATAAWLVGLGVGATTVVWENDRDRARVAMAAYAALAVLELIALARYAGTVSWSDPRLLVYLLFLLSALAIGLTGWLTARRPA